MNAIIDAAISHGRTVIASLILIMVAGSVAYVDIPKESDPDIDIPIIYVSMKHDGISPEDAVRLLVRPMEQELRSIEGVKEMRSTANEGQASVLLEFEAGFDADQALQDVREKADIAKNELPEETEDPIVNEVNVGLFPVLVVTVAGEIPERALVRIARRLRDDIEGLPGVLEADLAGDREEVLEVILDPVKLESYNISPTELVRVVTQNNQLIAAGAMDTGSGRFSIKVPGLFKTAKDVLELPIKVNGDGVVTLSDVTTVRRGFKDASSFARLNGQPAIALEVKKRLGENVISTIDDVRAVVAEAQKYWPAGVTASFSQDKSDDIRNMLGDLQNNVISAILLVMIVVVAALGLRSALLVGIAIPGSFLIGILYLYLFGMTINIVVLFSLILAVGMLVDGAIVVTEFADRKMAEGERKAQAYGLAAKRMAWPIIASTATTLAAFMPLIFWPGIVGEFMKFLPITLVVTLSGSLLMALVFVPTLGAQIGKPASTDSATMKALAAAETGDIRAIGGFTGRYVRLLGGVLRHPFIAALVAASMLIGVQVYYGKYGNGVEFFPDVEPDQAIIYIHARGNMSTMEKDALVKEVEQRIVGLDDFSTVYTRTGNIAGGGSDVSADVIGVMQLEYKDWQERRSSDVALADIRARTADLAGIHIEAREPEAGPPTGKDIQIQLTSRDPALLPPAVDRIRDYVETSISSLLDVEDSRSIPGIEWEIKVDRAQAGRFGADVATIGKTVQLVTNGIKVDEYRPDDSEDEVDIRVRFPVGERNIEQLDQLRVLTADGLVPISNFVSRNARPKVGKIERVDADFKLTIKANVVGGDGVLINQRVKEIAAWIEAQDFDPRIAVTFKGENEEQEKAQQFLLKAFGVALFVMAIILVTQFNSFYKAFLILSAVIMSTIGVMIGLIVTGQPFGIVMTGVGVIALAGIVVNNNIVLIDTFAHLKRQGFGTYEAIMRTGAQRLRPVMLTTVTTICGLLPMMFQVNIDFFERTVTQGAPSTQWWVQLATAVVFGLGFATILTLVVTPAMLALGFKVGWRYRRLLARIRRIGKRRARRQAAGQPAASGAH